VRALRADGPFAGLDEALIDAPEDALEGDAPSLSADAVAMPSDVPTPRKIASAPTLPMYLEHPTGAFSVRVDCCIAASYGMDDGVGHDRCGGYHRPYSSRGRPLVVRGEKLVRVDL
jgi:hypothetical protein